MSDTKNIQYGGGTHDFDALVINSTPTGIVTFDSSGSNNTAYEIKQGGVNKLNIYKDGHVSLPDCVDDDIINSGDITTLSKSFQVAGRYRVSTELTTASLTLSKDDNGKYYEISADSAAITITLDNTVITESWFDFYITDTAAPVKEITMINGTQTITKSVSGAFRIYKWGTNDTRLIKYSGAGGTGTSSGTNDTIQTSDGSGGFIASNSSIYNEGSNCHLYLGSTTSRHGIVEADGSIVALIDNDETSFSDGFYVRSRTVDGGVTVFQVIQNEATNGGVPSAPQSSNTKIDNVGNKALITKEYLDTKAVITKTMVIESPTMGDNITFFRVDADATILEVNSVISGTGAAGFYLYADNSRAYNGGLFKIGTSVSSNTTGTVAIINNASLSAGNWVWIEIPVAPDVTVTALTIDIRYSYNTSNS